MTSQDEKVIIKTPKGVIVKSLHQITHIKAEGSYSVIHFLNGDHHVLSKNLAKLKLPAAHFFRIHASIILNLNFVKKVEDSTVILSNKQELPIAKRRRGKFLAVLGDNFTTL